MQLPVSNHLDLLKPGAAQAGEPSDKASSCGAGRSSKDQEERGSSAAFQCKTSSRKEGGAAPGALHPSSGQPPRPARRRIVPGKFLLTAHCSQLTAHSSQLAAHSSQLADTDKLPPHHPPEEDQTNIGVQNILCSVKPLIMLA